MIHGCEPAVPLGTRSATAAPSATVAGRRFRSARALPVLIVALAFAVSGPIRPASAADAPPSLAPSVAIPGQPGAPDSVRLGIVPADPAEWAHRLEITADSIRVERGGDGGGESYAILRTQEGPYLALADLARIAGGPFKWDPETWRGGFSVDSVDVLFTLDAPFLWIRGEVAQLPAPVRYLAERVRIPAGALGAVVVPLLGERAVWDPSTGLLHLGGPRPWLAQLELSEMGAHALLRIAPAGEGDLRVRWDPFGRLRVLVRGVHLPPAYSAPKARLPGLELMGVHPNGTGVEAVVRVDPSWPGLRGTWEDGTWTLELTRKGEDVETGRYRQLGAYLQPSTPDRTGGDASRRILLEVGRSDDPRESDCLELLAGRLQEVLRNDFGHEVIRVADRSVPGLFESPSGTPETPGVPEADLWIGLRLEQWTSANARELLLVVPGMASREERVEVGAGAYTPETARSAGVGGTSVGLLFDGAVAAPWGQVARFFEPASRSLARNLAEHLGGEDPERPVRIDARPLRLFRGLAMPAVLLYPAAKGDADGTASLCDPDKAATMSRDIGFAVDEFLLGRGEAP